MRAPSFLSLLLLTAWGCGDGIGNPITGDGIVAAAAGFSAGGVGGARGVSAGAGAGSAPGAGSASVAGAGFGGMGGMSTGGPFGSGGTDRERPPPGAGLAPPWEGGAGWSGMLPPECEGAEDWDPALDELEHALWDYLNYTRGTGLGCPPEPGMPPTQGARVPPLMMRFELRCAARLHSLDMSENAYFGHINPQGVGPEDRMRAAGATDFRAAGETIAHNLPPPGLPPSPYDAIASIVAMGGSECQNLVDPGFDSVGIGVYGDLVTLDFTAH